MSDKFCWSCHAPYKSSQSIACSKCGKTRATKTLNTCENPECTNYNAEFEDKEYYCDLCTKPTTIGKEVEKALGL